MPSIHKSVLLKESVLGLNLPSDEEAVVVDATFGGGGHSLEILKQFPRTKVLAIDEDTGAWERVKEKFEKFTRRIVFYNGNFRHVKDLVGVNMVDGVLFDLGLSSDELSNSGRGFTFTKNEPLLMSMKVNPSPEDLTAKEIVNTWQEENLVAILRGYGEESFAKRIAKKIVEIRMTKPFETTFDLVEALDQAVPTVYKRRKIHFATKTFQALRIAVNDEMRALQEGLENSFSLLKSGGRIAVISFHSLEDRIVKNFFRDAVKDGRAVLVNKKIITPSDAEIKDNPRSRSAKLRIIQKVN